MNDNEYYELIAKLIISKSDIETTINEYVEKLKEDTDNQINEKRFREFLIAINEYFVELLKLCTDSLLIVNNVINKREEKNYVDEKH